MSECEHPLRFKASKNYVKCRICKSVWRDPRRTIKRMHEMRGVYLSRERIARRFFQQGMSIEEASMKSGAVTRMAENYIQASEFKERTIPFTIRKGYNWYVEDGVAKIHLAYASKDKALCGFERRFNGWRHKYLDVLMAFACKKCLNNLAKQC